MSRIKIEDLPVVENLTAEEKELIFGAGRPSFRPTLESLENREMMDAGLGYGLQVPLAQPTGGNQLALVRQFASEPVQQVNQFVHSTLQTAQSAYSAAHQAVIDRLFTSLGRQDLPQNLPQSMPRALSQGLPQGQQQTFSVQGDSADVTQRALQFLKDHVIGKGPEHGRFSNPWALSDRVDVAKTEVNGDQIKITFKVWYGIEGNPCEVKLIFQGQNTGVVKRYELVGAGLHDWKGFLGNRADKGFEGDVKNWFRNKVDSFEYHRIDEKAFVNNVIRQAELSYGARLGEFRLNKVERIDGGVKILLYTDKYQFNPAFPINVGDGVGQAQHRGLGELWLTFKYDDAQLAQGTLKLSEIRQGFHYRVPTRNFQLDYYDQKWHNTGDGRVHDQMREAKWNLGVDSSSASNAVLQKAADRLSADVVQWFKGRTGGSDARFHKAGPIDGHLDWVQATSDGMRVSIFVERNVEFTGRGGIRTPGVLYQRLEFELKYEGQVNGQHQFKVAGFQHQATSNLSEHYIFEYGLDAFGTNSNAVSAQFAQVRV